MKVSSLLVENNSRVMTGSSFVDSLIESVNGDFVGVEKLPVGVQKADWSPLEGPERIARTFSFSTAEKLKYFVNEMLSYQERSHHHAMISIDGRSVTVESYTHDVRSVTHSDLKLAKFADETYEDTRFFR